MSESSLRIRATHLAVRRTVGLAALLLLSQLCSGCNLTVTRGGTSGTPAPDDGGTTLLPPGSPCDSNAACDSVLCGLGGTGNCCAQTCPSTSSVCAASGCDDAGVCAYAPIGTACATVSCAGDIVTGPECDGLGSCSAGSVNHCPGHLACNDAGTGCLSRCTTSADCEGGTKCNHGFCVPPQGTGPCSEPDDCVSGLCGVAGLDGGGGHCCSAACTRITPPCGATDCDDQGSCVYAPAQTPCGDATCAGATLTEATFCDGDGNCPSPKSADCAPFACNLAGCPTRCSNNADCSGGLFCDQEMGACCALADGGSIVVDATEGSDAVTCCGVGNVQSCHTIGRAMRLIDDAQAQNVTIKAVVGFDGGGGQWSLLTPEPYPIRLGWGAELSVSQLSFDAASDGKEPAAIFEIGPYSANDPQGSASIYSATYYYDVWIGLDAVKRPPPAAIAIEAGGTLYLAGALVGSSGKYSTTAIAIGAGGKLVLGSDQSGTVAGIVQIDGADNGLGFDGFRGIVCGSDAGAGIGCTIRDSYLDGGDGLVAFGLAGFAIDAEDYADIVLHNLLLGSGNTAQALQACRQKPDAVLSPSVLVHGRATVEIDGASIACLTGDAFDLTASAAGTPSLTLDGATIMHTGRAVDAKAGKATITNSTIAFNGDGVVQDTDGVNAGTIDLGGGGNVVVCSSLLESAPGSTVPGVSVLNATGQSLDAKNVAWDTPSPDVFACDATLASCSCAVTSCAGDAGADGMSAVYEQSGGTIDANGNLLSPLDCTALACGAGGTVCPAGPGWTCCWWGVCVYMESC